MQESSLIKPSALFALMSLFGPLSTLPSFALNQIITLNPMISEWSAEILGKDKALKSIVGTSEYSNYPEYMKSITTVGPYPQIQIEKILSIHPDLVIASEEYNRPDQIAQLKKLKLKVVTLPRENFQQMDKWIVELGIALGEENVAKRIATNWRKALKEIKAPKSKHRVFFEIQFQPLITVGKNSFINDAFKMAGYENIFENISQAYPKVSKEAVLSKNPDTIFVFEMVKEKEDLEKIKATWKNSRVITLNGDDFSRCSPRLIQALKGIDLHE